MKNLFNKIYELTYSPLTTPFSLIENALLDNYKYVKYYTKDDFFIAEMQCSVNNVEEIFFYCFKDTYYLQKIYKNSFEEENCIFDRSMELDKSRKEYIEKNNFEEKFATNL